MASKYSYILAWKRVIDVIPVSIDFSQQLLPSETIQLSTLTVDVFVFAGYDTNPSDIINGSAVINPNNSNGIIQSVHHGVPGVTYGLVFWITTSTNRLISANAKLSVLLDSMPANPVYIPYYYTSWPYPVEYLEQFQVSILPQGGTWLLNPRYLEQIQVSIAPQTWNLAASKIVYSNWPIEQFQVSIAVQTWTLTLGRIVYTNWPIEQFQVSILPLSSTLTTGRVVYSNWPVEQFQVSIAPQGWTLT